MQDKRYRVWWQNLKTKNGTPGGIRTPNPLIRSQMIYPVDLPVLPIGILIMFLSNNKVNTDLILQLGAREWMLVEGDYALFR